MSNVVNFRSHRPVKAISLEPHWPTLLLYFTHALADGSVARDGRAEVRESRDMILAYLKGPVGAARYPDAPAAIDLAEKEVERERLAEATQRVYNARRNNDCL